MKIRKLRKLMNLSPNLTPFTDQNNHQDLIRILTHNNNQSSVYQGINKGIKDIMRMNGMQLRKLCQPTRGQTISRTRSLLTGQAT